MFSASVNSSTSPRRWRSSGMWPTPESRMWLRARPGRGPARRSRSCRSRRSRRPGERLDQLRLAVAVDAGDADDLARPHLERHAAHRSRARARRVRGDPRPSSSGSSGVALVLLDAKQDVASDHQPREPVLGRAAARQRLDLLPAAQHGDAVGDLEHLVELVADEDDRHALAHEVLEDAEELERLLRREHGRRLVEDEDVRARR